MSTKRPLLRPIYATAVDATHTMRIQSREDSFVVKRIFVRCGSAVQQSSLSTFQSSTLRKQTKETRGNCAQGVFGESRSSTVIAVGHADRLGIGIGLRYSKYRYPNDIVRSLTRIHITSAYSISLIRLTNVNTAYIRRLP